MADSNFLISYPRNERENMVYSEMVLIKCQQYNEIRNANDHTLDLCVTSRDLKPPSCVEYIH